MKKRIPTIGFISAPAWFNPAPSEFPNVCEETLRTQQAPVLLPDFDYRLESIVGVQEALHRCARSLAAMGCDVIARSAVPLRGPVPPPKRKRAAGAKPWQVPPTGPPS